MGESKRYIYFLNFSVGLIVFFILIVNDIIVM